MPAIQTTYTTVMRPGLAGLKADMTPETIVTGIAETAIGFGVAVFQGTGDRQVRVANGTALLVGISMWDQGVGHLTPPTTPDSFVIGDDVPVMKKGRIWVLATAAAVAGAPAYVIPASGLFTGVSTANTLVGSWVTSASGGALAVLSVNLS
jgi:hypothetical protein